MWRGRAKRRDVTEHANLRSYLRLKIHFNGLDRETSKKMWFVIKRNLV